MQVTQTHSDGLRHEFKIVVPASDLEARLDNRVSEIKDTVRLNGFRPGKVPPAHLKKIYGRSLMAEAIEALVRETNAKIVTDNGFKLAMEPKVTLPEGKDEIESVFTGLSDLSYTVALEVLPPITLADFKGIKIERPVAEITAAEIDEAVSRIADQNRPYSAKADEGKVASGDRVTISYVGKIDGEAFEGGTGDDIVVNVGSNTFIPGFEEQLVGMAAGGPAPSTCAFRTTIWRKIRRQGRCSSGHAADRPRRVTIDDAFAKTRLETLDKLKDAIKDRLTREHAAASRQKLKRVLLDRLDELHKFDAPPTMVEDEFNNVWKTVLSDLESSGKSFADEGTTEEKAKAEYRAIADRRVRLGLVLAEIGEKNNIKVNDEELSRAAADRARQFPGQEQQVWEYYRKNPQALASLRAPIYEEKVVDFIVELASVTDKPVSRDELFREEEDDEKK